MVRPRPRSRFAIRGRRRLFGQIPRERLPRAYRLNLIPAQRSLPSDNAWRPKDDFALLKALCFAEGRRLLKRNGLATGTVPYIQRLLSAGTSGRITQPRH